MLLTQYISTLLSHASYYNEAVSDNSNTKHGIKTPRLRLRQATGRFSCVFVTCAMYHHYALLVPCLSSNMPTPLRSNNQKKDFWASFRPC